MFWAVAIGLAAGTAALIVLAMVGRGRGDTAPAAASDVQVYRDQLNEVERDVARGTLSEEEAKLVRTEVARRLIDADRAAKVAGTPKDGPKGATWVVAALSAVVVVGGGIATYMTLGAPGYPDLPLQARIEMSDEARANRPGQAVAEAEMARQAAIDTSQVDPQFLRMIEQLRLALADRQNDLRGHQLLARNEAALGNFTAAIAAQQRVIALKGSDATATDHADLGEYMILAAGGYVSPEAETALNRALSRDGKNGTARYYSGLLYAQTGRPDLAFQLWRALLETGPESAPWMEPIRAQMADIADLAGVRYDIPEPKGPSADDIANAQEMTEEDRAEMIQGMVIGLADRLATQGGPPEDWARLIVAYGVLGDTQTAANIYREAKGVFSDDEQALAALATAATRTGLTP
ncbi:c-type cytochrome biogenesis protein CcmI [Oceaniglobus ichthyenteri]|uniref:c-type cytochrome biogenesis protein CcmI n=1 Tax=Oceaniglobus ichthyenteri TaxID=2136177 RepID=UPI000D3CDAE5|nr:c-type cytochrome biogenesis protein CcmI [Oceaniglobus ichthyenteri]